MTFEIPISHTKIVLPTLRPEVIHRTRLLALFDDLLDKKLIIIAAPAGYGKTTLMVDFARQSEMPVCWLSLDALDKDPQRFIAYFISAIEEQFHKFGKQSKASIRTLTNLDQDIEGLLSILINEIDAQIDEHFAIFVDDYQFVDSIPSIRDFFSRFILLAGENCHVVLASRRLPTLPDITLMVARQQVSGFDLEQLAFRADEIRQLFEQNYERELTEDQVEELMRQTEGWITGLHLANSGISPGVPDLTYAAHAVGVDLASYLDQQVLVNQSLDVREFLLETSLLEEFDAGLCEAVFGKGNWKHLIKTVKQNNLFILSVGPAGKWVRYHHLFQEFLQERIQQENPEKARTILLRLADVFEKSQEWEKACAIYKKLGQTELLAGLIERAGIPMLLNERLITFEAWLNELPAALLQQHPLLLSHKGALLCALGDGRLAKEVLDPAIRQLRKLDDLPDLASALVRRSAAHRLLGDYSLSMQDADEALLLTEDKPDLAAVYADAQRFKGINLNLLGRITEAVEYEEDALRRYGQLGEKQSMVRVLLDLGASYRALGNYHAARKMYEQALAELHKENNIRLQSSGYNNLGVLYHYQGEYEQAVRAFEAGMECARQEGSPWQISLLLASLGDVYIDLDEYEAAGQAYDRALEAAQQVSYQFLINYLGLAKARLARLCGDVNDAYRRLDNIELLIKGAQSNFEFGLFYLELGCLNLLGKGSANAKVNFEKALNTFKRGGLAQEMAWSRVWLAAANIELGDFTAARADLRPVLEMISGNTILSPLGQVIRRARPWLVNMREDPEIGPLLTSRLNDISRAEVGLPVLRKHLRNLLVTVPIQVPCLVIQAFGKSRVRVNGKLITSAQWKTVSVRELFFYILFAGHPLTKEEIGGAFWPDLGDREMKLRFKNDIYRLRHAVGQDVILFEDEHYHFNFDLDYEYDIENFHARLKKANEVPDAKEKISQLKAAVQLRTGPYLKDMDATWIWAERERLEQACLKALKQLAELQRQIGDMHSALETCEQALKIDLCREDFHRLAMQINADLGNRAGVIWQYKYCRDVLLAELDVAPSTDTEILYKQLTG
jgi:LuxR family transcriptional regulator, maltose regulon positive regulatory protein